MKSWTAPTMTSIAKRFSFSLNECDVLEHSTTSIFTRIGKDENATDVTPSEHY